jgi:DUF4097 and DUF4098 domain-containing protein YvlB
MVLALIMGFTTGASAKEYLFEYSKDVDVSGNAELILSNASGKVAISGGPVDKISIAAVKYVRAADPEEAEEVAARVEIKVVKKGNRVSVATNYIRMDDRSRSFWRKIFGSGGDSFGSVEYEITVPMDCRINVENLSGDVTVSDISESVYINAACGNLYVHNIRGEIDLETNSGQTRAAEIEGNISIVSTSSDIIIDSVTGFVDVRSTSGDAVGRSIFGPVTIVQTSGDVDLERILGDAKIKSTSGSIYLEQDSGSVDIVTCSGNIKVKTPLSKGGYYLAETTSGRIYFMVPSTASGSIEMETTSGDIRSEMPLSIKSRSRNRLSGDFGDGGPEIKLKTSSGDIDFGQY